VARPPQEVLRPGNNAPPFLAVKISDAKGNVVLEVTDVGPFLFLKLAPGSYTVSAEMAGRALTKSVRLKHKVPKEITLVWPEKVEL
jgi:hypothetical protein